MREVNFSIPNVNKASVGITTALYDRRALDCTSTLPLINSLNHLAYLTTSSARIRDILTVDGGVERLVCILKAGRSTDLMNMWKWNLAFQCVVNIGVRGSESVRTRVVEADMVPVIATILDNYIEVIERFRKKAELAKKAHGRKNSLGQLPNLNNADRPTRRQPPPPSIDIPSALGPLANPADQPMLTAPHLATNIDRSTYLQSLPRQQHQHVPAHAHNHPLRHRSAVSGSGISLTALQAPPTFIELPPVRDADRLPSMLPSYHTGATSQPESPTTPMPPTTLTATTMLQAGPSNAETQPTSRPSIRHQRSMSGESDDGNADEIPVEIAGANGLPQVANEPIVNIDSRLVDIRSMDGQLEPGDPPVPLDAPLGPDVQEAETFNITHRSPIDGSIINSATTDAVAQMGLSPAPTLANPPAILRQPQFPRLIFESSTSPLVLPSVPREEDVLMSLQLLAYVSKYTNLRSYFQKSHRVPKLRVTKRELDLLDDVPPQPDMFGLGGAPTAPIKHIENAPKQDEEMHDDDEDLEQEEYLVPDDYNIFPLVEKFTVRHHAPDMQYWAGVVMRNLCRKDDARGGIRQCAYFECGKWEEYQRQFAKCRRCRRTKYCSKECQKSAWVYHRHWCQAAQA